MIIVTDPKQTQTKKQIKANAARKRAAAKAAKHGYTAMKPAQLQAAGQRLEEKARKQREKARKDAERIAFLLANPKT